MIMKISKTLVLAAALAPIAVVSTAVAGPKADSTGTPTRLSGVVLKVDRSARTLTVREDNGHTTTVFVPEGKEIPLSRIGNLSSSASTVAFEHAQIGLRVRFVGTRN